MSASPTPRHDRERFWMWIIGIVSAILVAAVAFLILGPHPEGLDGALDVSGLPTVNASFNGLATVLLISGYVAVRRGRIAGHRAFMLSAFGASGAFLVSYVIYHWFKAGPTIYEGPFRGLYLAMLLSHIVLAVVIVPLALYTLYHGWNMHVDRHRRIARWTLPIWLYVSVTGVLIYWVLYV